MQVAIGPQSDGALIERMARGDERAAGELVNRYGEKLYALARSIVRDSGHAEEVVADAFMQAWRTAPSYNAGRGSAISWLAMITRSRALDKVRAERRQSRMVELHAVGSGEEAAPSDQQPDQAYEALATSESVKRVLEQLPEAQRVVIELAYFGGLSQSQISERLGVPLGTVKTRTLMAMKALRTTLAPALRKERA